MAQGFFLIFVVAVASCGASPLNLDGKIVGGRQIAITEAPHQVSVQNWGSHICGGSIISNSWILTAAHCTYESQAGTFQIRFGSDKYSSGGGVIRVAKLVQHKSFNYTNIDYDFSLLQLVKPLVFGATVSAIKLPEMNDKVADGALLQISGWGSTQSLSESRTFLRAALVPCVNQEKCQKAYEKFGGLTPRMLCAGFENGGKDACQGDSGGPLVLAAANKNDQILAGVVSWGYGCAKPGYPGVYAGVASVREWIRETSGV